MEEKASRGRMRRMNKAEFEYNKHLLREINDKRKASNYESESRADDQEAILWVIRAKNEPCSHTLVWTGI